MPRRVTGGSFGASIIPIACSASSSRASSSTGTTSAASLSFEGARPIRAVIKRDRSLKSVSKSYRDISSTYVIRDCTFSSSGSRRDSLIAKLRICIFVSVTSFVKPTASKRRISGVTADNTSWNSPTNHTIEDLANASSTAGSPMSILAS